MRSYVILSVFPTGVFRKVYTTYLLSSKLYGFSRIELKETIIIICCIIFSLFFPLGLKEFQQHILHHSSYFSHKVFGGESFKMMMLPVLTVDGCYFGNRRAGSHTDASPMRRPPCTYICRIINEREESSIHFVLVLNTTYVVQQLTKDTIYVDIARSGTPVCTFQFRAAPAGFSATP